jgi:spartin
MSIAFGNYEYRHEEAPPVYGSSNLEELSPDSPPPSDRHRGYEPESAPSYQRYNDYAEQAAYGSLYVNNYGGEPCFGSGYSYYEDARYNESLYRNTNTCDFRKSEKTFGMEPSFTADAEVTEATEEVLVSLRGAEVHLVDDQESLLLGEGDFSVVLIEQAGNGIVAFVRVGEDLRWPLTKDEPAVKLDSSHYFFTIRVPRPVDEMDRETARGPSQEVMTYGVTFAVEGQEENLRELDSILKNYNQFSSPKLVPVRDEFDGPDDGYDQLHYGLRISRSETTPSGSVQVTEGKPAEYWKAMAPNVDDYNSELAKTLASGTGSLIKGIFWLRNATVENLDNGTKFVKERVEPNPRQPSSIGPSTLNNLTRVENLSKATEQVATSVLNGAIRVAGFFTGALMRTDTAKRMVQLLPGEAALVSMDAFAKLFDAVEIAGTDIMKKTASFTHDVVKHRYGDEAGAVTASGLSTAGNLFSTAWTATKVRSAMNPVNFKPTKTGMLKAISKTVVDGQRWA